MKNISLPKFVITTAVISCVFCFAAGPLAQSKAEDTFSDGISVELHRQAVQYRESGLKYQREGDLDTAMNLYEKAAAVDPSYGVVYNDMGVIDEAKGSLPEAEENYLKAIKIDPSYLSAYTNLALFYENQRKLDKAQFYWSQRASLGPPDDPWTEKARNRLHDINAVLSDHGTVYNRQDDVLNLMKDVSTRKSESIKSDVDLAQDHFRKAKMSFDKGDLALAFKEGLDAQFLDQNNREIEAFIEKIEARALSR